MQANFCAICAVALVVGYGVAFVRGVSGFRIHAGHFAERYGLVVIIALGESIVAAGVGVSGMVLGAGIIVAVVVGIALAAALWWAYFDLVILVPSVGSLRRKESPRSSPHRP